jgi:eukaryotic-like serine/threonine-protein kinase
LTPSANSSLEEVEVTIVWQQLSDRVGALVTAWRSANEPPRLQDFLPAEPAPLRRMTLVEAIKIDLEHRWRDRRSPKTVEEYVAEFPELDAEGGIPCDIIYEEYHVRKRIEEAPPADYYRRFPDRADELRRLFDLETVELSAVLVPIQAAGAIEVGQRLDDFELLAALGKGAFATVFLARQCSMQRLVALKVSSDRGSEPQTLAQLDHPNIVRVFDQRQLADRQLRLLYMQYVSGGTLQGVIEHVRKCPPALRTGAALFEAIDKNLVKKGESPPPDSMTRYRLSRASWSEVVCWLGARLAAALAYAHDRGVLHRDVKPANVLVSAEGAPKLADFNVSCSKLDGATPAAYFGGSLAYMSPEQLAAADPTSPVQPHELDGRSDVFSLGVLLWELLTGNRPFVDESMPANWTGALAKMRDRRSQGVSDEARRHLPKNCSPGLAHVLLKCLTCDRDERYASAAEAAREFELCLQPRARQLMHGQGAWQAIPKRWPVTFTILCGLVPNAVMCLLNIVYNSTEIMGTLSPEARRVFVWEMVVVNSVSYAIGLSAVFYVGRPAFRAISQLAGGRKPEPPPDVKSLRRCLVIGDVAALVAAVLWTVSGPIFPAGIELAVGDTSGLTLQHTLHFVVSDALSGLIAATQCFYVMTFLAIRYCYPRLLQALPADAREIDGLLALARRSRTYFGLAVAAPFIAVMVMVFVNTDRWPVGVLGGVGLLGFALAYFFDVSLRGDLAALAGMMNPGGDALGSGDSFDQLVGSSRRF